MAVCAAALLHGASPETPAPRITSVVRADARTGKLVRSVVVSPKVVAENSVAETVVAPRAVVAGAPAAEPAVPPAGISELVNSIAAQHELNPQLIHSMIKVESNYNPRAVSRKGAYGLMQLIPATARRFGVADIFDPVENIQGGVKYLKYLLALYSNDATLALAAYNAGEAAVAKYNGIPPYPETQNYVIQVGRLFAAAQTREKRMAAQVAAATSAPEEKPEGGPTHLQEVVAPDGRVRYISR